jgi:DNA-directed RNA polymerase alpha subunit
MDVPATVEFDEVITMFNVQVMELALEYKMLADWVWSQSDAARPIQPIRIGRNNPWGVEEEPKMWSDLHTLDLSVRSYTCLKREGITTIAALCEHSYADLLDIRNFGFKSADEVVARLAQDGLSLKEKS